MNIASKNYLFYGESGEVICEYSGPDGGAGMQDYSMIGAVGFVESPLGASAGTHYVRGGRVIEKSTLSPTVTTDGMEATVSGLPADLTVLWDGEEGVTDDDPLELDHDEPGTYTLRIMGGAPYYDTSIEVTLG